MTAAPGLFETMRVEAGVALRLDAHLTRLARSAACFGVPFDRPRALLAIRSAVASAPRAPVLRLRLDLEGTGELRARASVFADDPPGAPVSVVLAPERVDADDVRQRHKTTDRGRYDRASRWAASIGAADAIFLDTVGRVAEGAISNVFVREDGLLLTPPVTDGALPGVLRAELLASGAAREASLTPRQLAGELYLGNALRGLRRARVVDAPG